VLIPALVAVVVVLGVIAAVLMLRRSHDDVHSVEHYHRQLHTLEEMRGHTTNGKKGHDPSVSSDPASSTGSSGSGSGSTGSDSASSTASTGSTGPGSTGGGDRSPFPASAFRVSGSSTVRLTESDRPVVPPVPPPPVPNASKPLTFDDANPEPVPATFMTGNEDRVIHSINHRPRRLGGPAAAVGAVLVLVLVLILTGLHSNTTPKHHGKSASAPTTNTTHPDRRHSTTTTTSTTAPPVVSAPTNATAHTATYMVSGSDYSLIIAATTGECWVDVTNTATGAVLFTTTLQPTQSHTIAATGPVTVIAGAPAAFTAVVNGATVALPPGNQAPFTLDFESATSASSTTTTTTAS
jgi:hypothetical protein